MPLNNLKWIENVVNIIYNGNNARTELVIAVKWKMLSKQ